VVVVGRKPPLWSRELGCRRLAASAENLFRPTYRRKRGAMPAVSLKRVAKQRRVLLWRWLKLEDSVLRSCQQEVAPPPRPRRRVSAAGNIDDGRRYRREICNRRRLGT
jgi:hypothetical protein